MFALERGVAVKNGLGRRERAREKGGEGVILPLLQPLGRICGADPRCHCRIECGGGAGEPALAPACTPACLPAKNELAPPLHPHTEESAARTIKSRRVALRRSGGGEKKEKKGLFLEINK